VLVVADVRGVVALSVASVAFGFPGTGVVVLVGLGEATEPSGFVEVGTGVAQALDFIQGADEVMDEHYAVVRERGHFSWSGLLKKVFERSMRSLERNLPGLTERRAHSALRES
jgi:hypothetical protein